MFEFDWQEVSLKSPSQNAFTKKSIWMAMTSNKIMKLSSQDVLVRPSGNLVLNLLGRLVLCGSFMMPRHQTISP